MYATNKKKSNSTSAIKCKGQVIFQHTQNLFLLSHDIYFNNRYQQQSLLGFSRCSICGCVIYSNNHGDHSVRVTDDSYNEKIFDFLIFALQVEEHHHVSFKKNRVLDYDCVEEKGETGDSLYCSTECKSRGQSYFLGNNLFHTSNSSEELHDVVELQKFLKNSSKVQDDMFVCSLFMICTIYRNVMEYEDQSDNELVLFATRCLYDNFDDIESGGDVDASLSSNHQQVAQDEKIFECWTLLRSAFSPHTNEKKSVSKQLSSSPQALLKIQRILKQNYLYSVSVNHPLYHFIEKKLLSLNDPHLDRFLEAINRYCGLNSDIQYHDSVSSSKDDRQKKLLCWRKATHLVQIATSQNNINDNEMRSLLHPNMLSLISKLQYQLCIFAPNIEFKHSCVPNIFVEGSDDGTMKALKLNALSLYDIKSDDILTTSKINNLDATVSDRAESLKLIFGSNFVCRCVRCNCERNWKDRQKFSVCLEKDETKTDDFVYTSREIKQIGDLAMQQTRYTEAADLYDLALKNCHESDYGDILHAKCASVLERGLFNDAQKLWREAFALCPTHKEIKLQFEKQAAYKLIDQGVESMMKPKYVSIQPQSFETIIPKKCYLTKAEYPLLSKKECEFVIKCAEKVAEEGGWTTSRHYAVPTTDLPIHVIPSILDWFNNLLCYRLRPLLSLQFGEEEVGKNGCNIHVHDAFIVRYDSKKQRHLPLHRDQSTHSFTIALNGTDEYDGGGTFIAKLNDSLRPSLGGVLSFRGDQLVHGGDPVVGGIRYIIVAFCYAIKSAPSTFVIGSKRRKIEPLVNQDEQNKTSNTDSNVFTFGFQL